jgi:uncharacterized membrane protein YuzA (DUF378 family)
VYPLLGAYFRVAPFGSAVAHSGKSFLLGNRLWRFALIILGVLLARLIGFFSFLVQDQFFVRVFLFVRFWRFSPQLLRAPHLRTIGLGFCGVVQSRISVVARMFREVNRTSRITYSLHPGFRVSLQLCGCRFPHHNQPRQDRKPKMVGGTAGYHAATSSDRVLCRRGDQIHRKKLVHIGVMKK